MNWLEKISQYDAWKKTREQMRGTREQQGELLFHGTTESIEDPVNPQIGGRGILWVAETPDVAQNYISPHGLIWMYSIPWKGTEKDKFHPRTQEELDMLKQMGYNAVADFDKTGRIQSFGIRGPNSEHVPLEKWPTNQDIINFIQGTLGYKPGRYGNTWDLKIRGGHGNHIEEILPADYHKPALLFMLIGRDKLNIYDMTHGGKVEGDLMDLQYNKLDTFKKLEEKGYDGVRINDFAHNSENWGNMGHHSIGLFPSGIAKLTMQHIPAVHYDWPETLVGHSPETKEFIDWHRSEVERAIKEGKPVPEQVARQYGFK